MPKRKSRSLWWLAGIAAVAILLLLAWLAWKYYPTLKGLAEPANMEAFQEKLRSFGALGAIILLGAQILQVLSGIVPSLPIQISAGMTYGALGGLALCLTGIAIGSTVVFLAVKRFGQPAVDKVFPKEKQEKLSFLNNASRLNQIVFLLYLIPAMPKDVFTYLAALTPMRFGTFMGITMVARTPMILCSTFASGALMEGRYGSAALVFCVSGTAGILGMLFAPKLLELLRRRKKRGPA